MTVMKQSTVIRDLRNQKTSALKVFEEFENECYGSSSDDSETYSPKSVVTKVRKWPATVKDVNVRRVRNQIERIRAEDSHLGEDIGESLIAKVSIAASHDLVDVMIFSRPASPLSGKSEDVKRLPAGVFNTTTWLQHTDLVMPAVIGDTDMKS